MAVVWLYLQLLWPSVVTNQCVTAYNSVVLRKKKKILPCFREITKIILTTQNQPNFVNISTITSFSPITNNDTIYILHVHLTENRLQTIYNTVQYLHCSVFSKTKMVWTEHMLQLLEKQFRVQRRQFGCQQDTARIFCWTQCCGAIAAGCHVNWYVLPAERSAANPLHTATMGQIRALSRIFSVLSAG